MLKNILLILIVILSFNFMIFIHELGHFLAAKWRGLKIDKFQIWFGKTLWEKKINGVTYGLGSIPAGGFVALPQMAPMELIEGSDDDGQPLPPIKPLDKIIVAVAGPIFSLLLAFVCALFVWKMGKPADLVRSTQIGYIAAGSPAEKAGFQVGDQVLSINNEPVDSFDGSLDSVNAKIALSEGELIHFTVKREGVAEPVALLSEFKIEKKPFYQRRGIREIGISPFITPIVGGFDSFVNSPAEKAGLKKGDHILTINGKNVGSTAFVSQELKATNYAPAKLTLERGEQIVETTITPLKPTGENFNSPMIGVSWDLDKLSDSTMLYPTPAAQIKESVRHMLVTIDKLFSPKSSIGIDQLSGPISIAKAQFDLLNTEQGIRRLLYFLVIINVNLAIFNMLPIPVLDGGHTVMALYEIITRRPIKAKLLEYVQSAFAILFISLFLYVMSKDVGSFFTGGQKAEKIVFPE